MLFRTEILRKYIEHQDFILETDNQALSWLLSHPRQLGKTGRRVVKISALKFEVRHVRGMQNILADTLSRMFESPTSDSVEQVESHLVLTDFPLAFQELAQLQWEDPTLAGSVAQLEKDYMVGGYTLSKGILYCHSSKRGDPKLVVTAAAIPMVFAYFHESPLGGHLGVFKTISKIRSQVIWKGMDKDIRSRVRACHTCALSKPVQNSHWRWLASYITQRSMQKIFIDYVPFIEVKPVIPLYLSVLMPFPSLFGWFRLGNRRLERRLRPFRRTYLVVFVSWKCVRQCPVFHFYGIPAILLRAGD